MDSVQLGKAFTATVQASLHGLQSIEPVLQREQDALLGKDPETLQQVVREKLVLLKELEHSVHARDRLQKAAGLPAGNEGAGKLVEGLQQQALTQDWVALTKLAQRVAELNDRNGRLAIQGQRNARAALGILTGRTASDDTYSTLRRRSGGVASYTLGKV